MTLAEIKGAVERGDTVHWSNTGYHVSKDRIGQWLIVYTHNGHTDAIGLTWTDGVTLNGEPAEFFVAPKPKRAHS